MDYVGLRSLMELYQCLYHCEQSSGGRSLQNAGDAPFSLAGTS